MTRIDPAASAALVASLREALPHAAIEEAPSHDLHTTIFASRDHVIDVLRTLRDRPDLAFTFLVEITAADFWPKDEYYELVYILVSMETRRRLRVKVRLARGDAHVPTVTGLWAGANWLEREVWDLFGIAFDGHPDPRRLLMPEDWEGHPLRKDYPVQIRKTPQSSEPLQLTAEEFRANVMKDRLARE
jgi:NADH-quinone oxidoreductase subunit C